MCLWQRGELVGTQYHGPWDVSSPNWVKIARYHPWSLTWFTWKRTYPLGNPSFSGSMLNFGGGTLLDSVILLRIVGPITPIAPTGVIIQYQTASSLQTPRDMFCWTVRNQQKRKKNGDSSRITSHRIHGTGMFTYIYHTNQPNVGKYTGKYTIHGSYGIKIPILQGGTNTEQIYGHVQGFALKVWALFGRTDNGLDAVFGCQSQFDIPSRELTYPPKNGILKTIFLFPRWDMLIPWRVYLSNKSPVENSYSFLLTWFELNTKNLYLCTIVIRTSITCHHIQGDSKWPFYPLIGGQLTP